MEAQCAKLGAVRKLTDASGVCGPAHAADLALSGLGVCPLDPAHPLGGSPRFLLVV